MKVLIPTYTFNASQGVITITNFPQIKQEQILLITNTSVGKIIYSFADPNLGAFVNSNVIYLSADTSAMSNTDSLQIFIEDYFLPSSENTLSSVNVGVQRSNVLLNALTARQDTFNIDISAVNINTNELEGLAASSNTKLNALTAVDYATRTNQNTLNQNVSSTNLRLSSIDLKFTTLINQTDGIEGAVDQVENKLDSIVYNTQTFNWNTITSNALVSSININNFYIFAIEGTSYAGYDQHLQVLDQGNNILIFTQKIKAGENFKFNFTQQKNKFIVDGTTVVVRNSLTPFTHTPGNCDLYINVFGANL
jgi:hypothetical protein